MYGILVVEDGNETYQIIGEVASQDEARELADNYEKHAHPDNPQTICPPDHFVIWRRGLGGAYTQRELLNPNTTAARLDNLEKLARHIPFNSPILMGIQECRDRLNGKD
jgi:hypothetical protein